MTKPDSTVALVRNSQLTAYVAGAPTRPIPPEILLAARRALVDFLGVSVGAWNDAPSRPVRALVDKWAAPGGARMFLGARTTPALAALANGTAAHAMDYDDTHPLGAGHPSACCWSTALAVAEQLGASETQAMWAFLTGFEIMARLGGGGPPGVGRSLQRAGFHPTSVFGRAGAAAVAGVLMRLDQAQISNALGIAATTAGGLLGSFGTHGKPFHAGKAAMDGIMAADLAAEGFLASPALFEVGRKNGLFSSFIQTENPEIPPLDFDDHWEILNNAFKLFASCRGTHPSAQAAQSVAAQIRGRTIKRVRAQVHPNALVAAGNTDPKTPLEGKFSLAFCIALGLRGYHLLPTDFADATMQDRSVMELVPLITCEAVADQPNYSAHLEIIFEDDSLLRADTEVVIGHRLNPVSWDDLRRKFDGLVEPVLGVERTGELFDVAKAFDEKPGSLARITDLLASEPLKQ
jgi:2-methylcitrate dehydratase PrpD